MASLRRWMARDRVGQALAARVDTLEATAGDTLTLLLTRPILGVPLMLTKSQLSPPVIMPARLAATSPFTPVPEIVGSGPFRLPNLRWRPGEDLDLLRFADYQPRPEASSFTGGGRTVLLDRVLWRTPDDPVRALRDGAVDWVEMLPPDRVDAMLQVPGVTAARLDGVGYYALLRLNTRHGPTANQGIRQAILAGIDQTAVMEAVFGAATDRFATPLGLFPPASIDASSMGMDRLGATQSPRADQGPPEGCRLSRGTDRDPRSGGRHDREPPDRRHDRRVDPDRRDGGAADAGSPGPRRVAVARPGGRRLGRAVRLLPAADQFDGFAVSAGPAPVGEPGWPGWPDTDGAGRLRDAWIDAADLGARPAIAARLQAQVFTTAAFVPLGQWFPVTAWRTSLTGPQRGCCPVFWDISRA